MKKALISIGTFILLVVVGIVAYLMLADFSSYKTDIEQAIADATGREARIDGAFVVEALPPSIVIEGLTFANTDWGSEGPALSIGHFSARVDGSSLFSGPLVIEEIRLHDVDILVEKSANGDNNWSISQQDDTVTVDVPVDDADTTGVILQFAELRNITLTRRAPDVDDQIVTIEALDVTTAADDYLEATGSGSYDGQPMSLDARVGPASRFSDGRDLDVSVQADLGILVADVEGNTGNLTTLAGTEFEIGISSSDVARLVTLLELPAEVDGAMNIEAAVSGSDGDPRLTFDATIATLEAGGSVLFDEDRMTVDVRASSLSQLGEIVGATGLPAEPVTAAGQILARGNALGLINFTIATSDLEVTTNVSASIDGDRVQVDPFAVTFGESDLSGRLDIVTGEPISISGEVNSKLLDLTPFAGEETDEEPADPAEPGEFVLSDEPLPLGFLAAGTIDLTVSVDAFRSGPLRLRDVNTSIKLEDGALQQESSFSVEDGGTAESKVAMVASGNSATLDVELNVADLKLRLGTSGERSAAEIPVIGLQADIDSQGNSLHALAAASNGKLIFTQGPGLVNNEALGVFSVDIITELLATLNPFSKSEPYSVWDCTVVGMTIVDGVATMNPVLAQSEKVTIVAEGEVDFNDESLNLGFNTKPRQGVGVSADMFLTPFIRLGGTMSAPRMALDKTGVILEGGAALLTGGISFLVQGAADRATGGQDRCDAALALAEDREIEASE